MTITNITHVIRAVYFQYPEFQEESVTRLTVIVLAMFVLCGGCEKDQSRTIVNPSARQTTEAMTRQGNTNTIQVGYFVSTPHIFYDNQTGEISGAVFDMLEDHIGPMTGIRFIWEKGPSTIPRQLVNVKQSERYMAGFLAYVPSRKEFAVYSKRPFFYGHSNLTVPSDNPITTITSVDNINHLKIGYAKDSYISPFMRHPSIRFEFVANPDYHGVNLEKVQRGHIDAVYAQGRGSMLVQLTQLGLLDKFRMINLPEDPVPIHFLYSKDLVDDAARIDDAIEKLGGPDFYTKLLSNYVDINLM